MFQGLTGQCLNLSPNKPAIFIISPDDSIVVRGGRKAQIEINFNLIASLLFFGLFGVAVLIYVSTTVDASAYFANIHSHDLQDMAIATAAGNGDVLLRYNNFRDDIEFGFHLKKGRIEAGKLVEGGEKTEETTSFEGVAIVNPQIRLYGLSLEYPLEKAIGQPSAIILRKIGEQFVITESMDAIEVCPSVIRPKYSIENTKVLILTDGSFNDAETTSIIQSFNGVGDYIPEATNEQDATLIITIRQEKGTPSLTAKATADDGREILCRLHKQLAIYDPVTEYTLDIPSTAPQSSIKLEITLTTSSESTLKASQIGTMLKSALLGYFQ